MKLVAVGFDTPAKNKAWADEEGFNFEVWDDDEKTLAVTYGAAADTHQARPDRVTAILDADGVLVDYYPVVHVSSHAESVLEDCQALFGH